MSYPNDYRFAKSYQEILLKTANSEGIHMSNRASRRESGLSKIIKWFVFLKNRRPFEMQAETEIKGFFYTGKYSQTEP